MNNKGKNVNIKIPRFAWRILAVLVAAALTAGALIVATTQTSRGATPKDAVRISESVDHSKCAAVGETESC